MQSLNLYQAWNTTEPAWSVIEPTANRNETSTPVAFFAATYLQNSHMFFIDGGVTSPSSTTTSFLPIAPSSAQPSSQPTTSLQQQAACSKKSQTIYYDTSKNSWVNPTIKGQALVRR